MSTLKELRIKLDKYRKDLAMVEGLLESEPGNKEFMKLQTDLSQYVTLTEDLIKSKEGVDEGKAKGVVATFGVGDEVSARWNDGMWYDARVEAVEKDSIVGTARYLVTYKSYGTQETIPEHWVKVQVKGANNDKKKDKKTEEKRAGPKPDREAIAARMEKRKRVSEAIREREEELSRQQSSWKSFVSKGSKKRKGWARHKSIFKVPEAPTGRVGVIGSGKRMTTFAADRRKLTDVPLSVSSSTPMPNDLDD